MPCRRRATRRGPPGQSRDVIDYLPVYLVIGIGWVISIVLTVPSSCVTTVAGYDVSSACSEPSITGPLAQGVLTLVALAYAVWNFGYRQGITGSSIGKSVMKFKVVSEVTGQPLGFAMSVVRQLAHVVDAIDLLHRFLVSALGRQASNSGGQDHDDGLPADLTAAPSRQPSDPAIRARQPRSSSLGCRR